MCFSLPRAPVSLLSALLLFFGVGQACLAVTTIVDSVGFEPPSYTTGALTGQPSSSLSSEQWKYAGFGVSTAVVQTDIVRSGNQAVEVNKGAGDDSRWAIPVDGSPVGDLIVVQWDMYVEEVATAADYGPFLGVETYDGAVAPTQNAALVGSLGVDATTRDVLYQAEGTGYLVESGWKISFGQWNEFRLVLDYANGEYQSYLNDVAIVQEGFVDSWADEFTDADLSVFAADSSAASQNAPGTVYYDNFLVTDIQRLAGDYDIDGDVDNDDYQVWRNAYGSVVLADGLGADGNGDGLVNAADYTVWRDNLTGGALAAADGAIPEPSTLLLTLVISSAGLTTIRLRAR